MGILIVASCLSAHIMFLDQFYTKKDEKIYFSRDQASRFAKQVANDFNPIHDIDAKRFCVPGDLLFALTLCKFGLSQKMKFVFSGMVNDKTGLIFPNNPENTFNVTDDTGKKFLKIEREGDISTDQELIKHILCSYVLFSGKTFPHILVPLMSKHNVMINPDRPLVVYESISVDLKKLDIDLPKLEINDVQLNVQGKRGNVCFDFSLTLADEMIGTGKKHMVMSGLRPFDEKQIQAIVDLYNDRKESYLSPE